MNMLKNKSKRAALRSEWEQVAEIQVDSFLYGFLLCYFLSAEAITFFLIRDGSVEPIHQISAVACGILGQTYVNIRQIGKLFREFREQGSITLEQTSPTI